MKYEAKKDRRSSLLFKETRAKTDIYTVEARSLLNKATGFMAAYDFTLNPYRGCQYGCSYCYAAAFSPDSQKRQDWGNWVAIKTNAADLLDRELTKWQKKYDTPPRIYMSSVTDPYQPIEKQQELTKQLLKVMLIYQPILVIQTRSPMIVRDLDLLQQFEYLRINLSIPTGSEIVRKDFEPRSPSVKARLQTINKLRYSIASNHQNKIYFSVTITPLLPTLIADRDKFFSQLMGIDRIVLQDFHPTHKNSLIASTPHQAIALKQKYAWWYDDVAESYHDFKQNLENHLIAWSSPTEILEGKAGFAYD
ncbi:radical SAM protein [Waterburya agarophytonicola K14]|uniref:Radical SAM protein n=1 Tax=Waterburya agarophytonicola KI4 TaxID=2874699 RepID=A0A964BU22_9CYAN|nr:radical SAM protein [Waterburya agarophytonicola]MCC0178246.1 radical SAM protein [Waterburya agarophytonicola KI4]